MSSFRLIARLDVKGTNVVKGVQLEGLRKLGEPNLFAKRYYANGIDEILYMDVVASLYERSNLLSIVKEATKDVFIPITAGGGIRSVDDAAAILRAGADKVAVNTAALKRPEILSEISNAFGSQCVVLSVEAKRNPNGGWTAYYDNGREKSGEDVLDWIQQSGTLGIGEILLTSVDQEGTAQGFDMELIQAVTAAASVPVIASGGMGNMAHLVDLVGKCRPNAVAMAHVLHYDKLTIPDIRERLINKHIPVRSVPSCR
ncbi:MAG: imidazole glycerol phosphate synthase cyclase subunit [Holosporales bacterium]|jgi:cyclase|nr:imidazole glycerol phosphate synthase cyclase subunit [Holosporales bacterium]